MNIQTLTTQQAMELMGSEASEAEAAKMIELLRAHGATDTDEIGDAKWNALIQRCVAEVAAVG